MKLSELLDRAAGAKSQGQLAEQNTIGKVPATMNPRRLPLTKTALTVAAIGVSFYLGTAYQARQASATTLGTSGNNSQNQNQNGSTGTFGSGNGLGGYGGLGGASMSTEQVTAIGSTNITVKGSSGDSQTYAITSDTVITDNGERVSASDIQTGGAVLVIPERDDTSTARRIIVNPDFDNQNSQQSTTVDPSETQLN